MPEGLFYIQVQVGIYSKGSYAIERGDKLSLFEFLNEASIYKYLIESDNAEVEKNKK